MPLAGAAHASQKPTARRTKSPSVQATSLRSKVAVKRAKKAQLPQPSTHLTDDELRADVEQLLHVLAPERIGETPWDRRLEAIQRLSDVLQAPHAADRRCFLSIFGSHPMKRAIIAQLQDLRSSVVRAACQWVLSLCHACAQRSDVWVTLCDAFVPALLHCRSATVAAIAQASEEAIAAVVGQGVVNRTLLQTLTHACSGRNATLRGHTFRYLSIVLCRVETHTIRKYFDLIASCVHEGLVDAAEDSRKYARLCFWGLELGNEEAALAFYESLPDALQVKLDEEKPAFNAALAKHREDIERLRLLHDPTARLAGSGQSGHPASAQAHPNQDADRAPQSEEGEAPQPLHRAGDAKSDVPQGATNSVHTPMRHAHVPRPASPSASTRKPRTTSPRADGYATEHSRKAGRTPSRQSPSVADTVGRTKRTGGEGGTSPLAHNGGGTDAEAWHQIMTMTQSTDWSARVTGVNKLTRAIARAFRDGGGTPAAPHPHLGHLTKAQVADVMRILPFRIGDPHYRVSTAALDCFDGVLANLPSIALEEMPHLLGAIFAQVVSPKEVTRDAARRELQSVASVYDADVLLAPLYRVLDVAHQNHKVKQSCLEFVVFLIQNQPKLFTAAMVRNTLARLMHHYNREMAASAGNGHRTAQGGADVANALGACMGALYQASSDGFLRAVLLLPPAEQQAVIGAVGHLVPHIGQDVQRAAAGERLLHHPDVTVPSPFQAALRESSPAGKVDAMMGRQQMQGTSSARAAPVVVDMNSPSATTTRRVVPTEGGASVTRSSKHLFEDVSILNLHGGDMTPPPPQVGGAASSPHGHRCGEQQQSHPGAPKHYDANAFSASNPQQADVLLRGVTAAQTRTAVAGRIYDAINHHRMPPDVLLQLRTSSDAESRRSALLLANVAVTERPMVWVEFFSELIAFAISLCSDGDHSVRVMALRCMESVVKHEALVGMVAKVLPMLMQSVLIATEDPFPEVQREAAVLFHVMCSGGFYTTEAVVLALLHYISHRVACTPSFVQALEELGVAVWRAVSRDGAVSGEASVGWLSDAVMHAVVQKLLVLFGHELSEVRKTVVGVLVCLWAALGRRVLVPLKPLSTSQRKLVSIYYQRHALENALAAPGEAPKDLDLEIGNAMQ